MDGETEASSAGEYRQLLQSLTQGWVPLSGLHTTNGSKGQTRHEAGTWEAVGSRERSHLQQIHAVPESGHC